MNRTPISLIVAWILSTAVSGSRLAAQENVYIDGVPDYEWDYGCFGTASGNLFGFWDRNGFPDFYTGPTGGGLAPLTSWNRDGNSGIRSLWASAAGVDGRPADKPGHVDDYYVGYESVAEDPYKTAGRAEHAPDCIGDFIGLNQRKWLDLNGECQGNIDAYSFVYWNKSGSRRNALAGGGEPTVPAGSDIPSGLIDWSRYKGYDADVFCQLAEYAPGVSVGNGFSFADMKREIDGGYPVLLFLQPKDELSRTLRGQTRVNPEIHGMLVFGYLIEDGVPFVRFRTSWATGDNFAAWGPDSLTPPGVLDFPLRGVIGYHPKPRIRVRQPVANGLLLKWDAPAAILVDDAAGERRQVHRYVVEQATTPDPNASWTAVTSLLESREATVPVPTSGNAFYRIRLVVGDGP